METICFVIQYMYENVASNYIHKLVRYYFTRFTDSNIGSILFQMCNKSLKC